MDFQGQGDARWPLSTSLQREAQRLGMRLQDLPGVERAMVRLFKRQYHQFQLPSPDEDDHLGWLAMMQHYGAPTRLMDWTYSFFIAVYFALEASSTDAAVWALNTDRMPAPVDRLLGHDLAGCYSSDAILHTEAARDRLFYASPPISAVLAVNPYYLHTRLVVQQGIFVCPLDVTTPFEQNLASLAREPEMRNVLRKTVIKASPGEVSQIVRALHRMNINAAGHRFLG